MLDRVAVIRLIWSALVALCLAEMGVAAETEAQASRLAVVENEESSLGHIVLAADSSAEPRLSDAQRISRLQRTLDSDEKHLAELRDDLASLEKEYAEADDDFKQLDTQLEADKRQSVKQTDAAAKPTAAKELAQKWDLARQRFELAIRQRKALQKSIATLEAKTKTDRSALQQLLKAVDSATDPSESRPAVSDTEGLDSSVSAAIAGESAPAPAPAGNP
ncbi:MAG TPA: hypothetical protein VGH74_11435, partial [Planctomycetaceae bacterium]